MGSNLVGTAATELTPFSGPVCSPLHSCLLPLPPLPCLSLHGLNLDFNWTSEKMHLGLHCTAILTEGYKECARKVKSVSCFFWGGGGRMKFVLDKKLGDHWLSFRMTVIILLDIQVTVLALGYLQPSHPLPCQGESGFLPGL